MAKIKLSDGAKLLRAWRERERLNINAAATRNGIARPAWVKWEAGWCSPNVRTAALLEDLAGVPMRAWTVWSEVPASSIEEA